MLELIECTPESYFDALGQLPPSFAARAPAGGIVAFMSGEPSNYVNGIPTFAAYLADDGRYFATLEAVTPARFAAYLAADFALQLQPWAWGH
jgi:hypothetical protein